VRTAALRVPIGRPDSDDLLAACLAADPIDGVLLFPLATHPRQPLACLSPRTARTLARAGELLADVCHDLIIPASAPPDDPHTEAALRDLVRGWNPDRIHHLGTALDTIAEHLRDGLEPMPSTVTDHVALQLIIDRARTLPTEWPEVFRGRHLLLPEHPDDNVFDWLLDLHVDPRNLADGAR
jgi:hypothetical protein